jgi:hypothetical protein
MSTLTRPEAALEPTQRFVEWVLGIFPGSKEPGRDVDLNSIQHRG